MLRPAKGIKKGGGILIRFSFPQHWTTFCSWIAGTHSLSKVGFRGTPRQAENSGNWNHETYRVPRGNWTTRNLSKTSGHWPNYESGKWSLVSEHFWGLRTFSFDWEHLRSRFWFCICIGKNMRCHFLLRRTEPKDNDCPECFRAMLLLLTLHVLWWLLLLTGQDSQVANVYPCVDPPAAQSHRLLLTGIFDLAVKFHCFSQVDKKSWLPLFLIKDIWAEDDQLPHFNSV